MKNHHKIRIWSPREQEMFFYWPSENRFFVHGKKGESANEFFAQHPNPDQPRYTYRWMLCTGITDTKDNLIYEDDLVIIGIDQHPRVIVLYHGAWVARSSSFELSVPVNRSMRVIGNIHQGM